MTDAQADLAGVSCHSAAAAAAVLMLQLLTAEAVTVGHALVAKQQAPVATVAATATLLCAIAAAGSMRAARAVYADWPLAEPVSVAGAGAGAVTVVELVTVRLAAAGGPVEAVVTCVKMVLTVAVTASVTAAVLVTASVTAGASESELVTVRLSAVVAATVSGIVAAQVYETATLVCRERAFASWAPQTALQLELRRLPGTALLPVLAAETLCWAERQHGWVWDLLLGRGEWGQG